MIALLKLTAIVLVAVLVLAPQAAAGRSVQDILAGIVEAVQHAPTALVLSDRAPPVVWHFDVWTSDDEWRSWFVLTYQF